MRHAADYAERKVLPAASAEVTGDMVLNWAFLVPKAQVDAFHAQVHELNLAQAQHGLVLRDSGGWPPFSFTPNIAESDA